MVAEPNEPKVPSDPVLSRALDVWTEADSWHGPTGALSEVSVVGLDLSIMSLSESLDWTSVSICDSQLLSAQISHTQLTDVFVERCSLAGARLEGSHLQRVAFHNSQISGIQLSDAVLKDVSFHNCKVDYANFRFTKLQRVAFLDCELEEADFGNSSCENVLFERCRMNRSDISNSKFNRCSIRDCDLTTTKGLLSLQGVSMPWVDVVQIAGSLATAVGIHITGLSESSTGNS